LYVKFVVDSKRNMILREKVTLYLTNWYYNEQCQGEG